MDNETLVKLLENYDKNIKEVEDASKQLAKDYKIVINIRNSILSKLTSKELEAENNLREEVEYLKMYTRTQKQAQKELDFVRTQVDKYGFEFSTIAQVYSEEFYPLAKQENVDSNTIHNLFAALVEYASSQNATTTALAKLLSEFTKFFKTDNKSKEVSSLPFLNKDINKVISMSSKESFLQNFSAYMHHKYKKSAIDNINPSIASINRKNNKIYDYIPEVSAFRHIFNTATGGTSAISFAKKIPIFGKGAFSRLSVVTALANLLPNIVAESRKIRRYKEGNLYRYEDFEPGIFTPDEYRKIYGQIEMFAPVRYMEIKNAPPKSYIYTHPDSKSSDTSSSVNNNTFNFNIQSTEPKLAANEIKQVMAGVFDDFNLAQGFYYEN